MMLRSESSPITLSFQAVQEQCGNDDCGFFSLAYATSLCAGENPAEVNYDQHLFRGHLLSCIQQKKIALFPRTDTRRQVPIPCITLSFDICCICRLPEDGRMFQCIRCDRCCHVHPEYNGNNPNSQWCCNSCKRSWLFVLFWVTLTLMNAVAKLTCCVFSVILGNMV